MTDPKMISAGHYFELPVTNVSNSYVMVGKSENVSDRMSFLSNDD